MSDSFEKNLIETNDGESDEPDHSLGFDSQTMPSTSKKIKVMNNPNSFGSVNPELTASVNTKPESPMPSLPPPLQRSDSMGSRIFTAIGSKLAAGSIKGSIFTMIISIVGAGCLALPYAMRNVGLIFGISLIILAAPLAYFTSDLLLISAEYLPETLRGPKPLRDISYQTLAQHSYGSWLSKALKWIMAVQYYGGHVGYLVAFSGFIDLVYSIYPHPHGWPHSIYNICVIGLGFGVTFPLGLMRSVDSLRFTSLLGFTCSSYLVLVVTIEYFVICHEGDAITGGVYKTTCFWSDEYHIGQKELWPMVDFETTARGFLTAFPLVVFAYTGHPFVMPLYVELARPSIRRMRKVFYRGLAIVTVLYFCISTFGFLLFLRRVCSNLLLNDFRKHIDVVIAALGISLSCMLTEPIYSYNFRRMIGLIAWNKSSSQISNFWHVTITFLLVASNVGLALEVSSIAVVFGFLGSTTYPLLGYILPAAFFVKITPPGSYPIRKKFAIVQAVIVGIISLCSLAYKFYDYGDQDCDNAQNIGNR